jgi:hypothetical protein
MSGANSNYPFPCLGNLIAGSSKIGGAGGSILITNGSNSSNKDTSASLAFIVAGTYDMSGNTYTSNGNIYGNSRGIDYINSGGFVGASDKADVRITAIIDTATGASKVGTACTFKVSPDSTADPVEAMRISSSGNVGIGNINPQASLDIYNAGGAGVIKLQGNTLNNIGIGNTTLTNIRSGSSNTGFGLGTLASVTTGQSNTAVGHNALQYGTLGGSYNTAVGFGALANNNAYNYNTALGHNAFNTNSGYSNSTAIGYNAQPNSSNQIMMGTPTETVVIAGNAVVSKNLSVSGGITTNGGLSFTNTAKQALNLITFSNGEVGKSPFYIRLFDLDNSYFLEFLINTVNALCIDMYGNIGIRNNNPQYALDVAGSARISGTTHTISLTSYSSTLLAKSHEWNYIEVDTGGFIGLIDFHTNSAALQDWDARILVSSTSTTNKNGTAGMSIDASFVQMTRVIASSLSNSGTLTNTGLITANGGLTIGGSNNITLGAGTTTPTAGQLGYTIFGTIASTSNTAGTETTVSTINITPGVWLCSATVQVSTNQSAYSGVNYTSIYNTSQTSKYCLSGLAKGGAFSFYNNLTIVYLVTSGTQNVTLNINPTTTTAINTTLSYFSATRIA